MSSIKTYEDLEAEEKRLNALLYSHKESMKENLVGIKKGLKPVAMAASTVGMAFVASKANPLLKLGLNFGFDVLLGKFLLKKAGWLTKIAVPFFMKNFSSHLLHERSKAKIFKRVKSFFSKSGQDAASFMGTVKDKVSDITQEVKQSVASKL